MEVVFVPSMDEKDISHQKVFFYFQHNFQNVFDSFLACSKQMEILKFIADINFVQKNVMFKKGAYELNGTILACSSFLGSSVREIETNVSNMYANYMERLTSKMWN